MSKSGKVARLRLLLVLLLSIGAPLFFGFLSRTAFAAASPTRPQAFLGGVLLGLIAVLTFLFVVFLMRTRIRAVVSRRRVARTNPFDTVAIAVVDAAFRAFLGSLNVQIRLVFPVTFLLLKFDQDGIEFLSANRAGSALLRIPNPELVRVEAGSPTPSLVDDASPLTLVAYGRRVDVHLANPSTLCFGYRSWSGLAQGGRMTARGAMGDEGNSGGTLREETR